MKVYDHTWLKSSVAADRRRIANYGTFSGVDPSDRYFNRCRAQHIPSGTTLVFTRDFGGHSSGWWKNPEYERCYHLSLAYFDPVTKQQAPRDVKLSKEWIELFFGPQANKLWCEPPYSDLGKAMEIWHYRLFCNPAWEPIIPRGEVYTREFTEAGWLSYSDVQAELTAESERKREVDLNR